MAYNHEKNWFEYKGRYYGYGTIVKLKSSVFKGVESIEECCNGIMKFTSGLTNGYIKFLAVYKRQYAISGVWNPNDIIEYIVEPVYANLQPVWKNAVDNYKNAEPEHKHLAFPGTLWYIAAMVVGTLFYDRVLIYIAATIIYGVYWVGKYRD